MLERLLDKTDLVEQEPKPTKCFCNTVSIFSHKLQTNKENKQAGFLLKSDALPDRSWETQGGLTLALQNAIMAIPDG